MSQSGQQQLPKDYVVELIKGCISSKKILEICHSHLKYEYPQTEQQKKVLKYIFETFTITNQSPTLGMIAQAYNNDKEIVALLTRVKQIDIKDKEDILLGSFESFIKEVRFVLLYERIAELYDKGKKDEAITILSKESQAIANFNIKQKYYATVFKDYDKRKEKRKIEAQRDEGSKKRLTSGIHAQDDFTRGGYKKGTSFLGLARSGVGKTTYLRWVALCNAQMGEKVILFQGEDTEEEALNMFDSAWTSVTVEDLETDSISAMLQIQIRKAQKHVLAEGGEIFVYASEQFDQLSVDQCDEIAEDIIKIHGPVGMILFDYLEIMTTKGQWGKGEAAERRRREDIANKITNMAIKYNCVTGTMTQAMDIEQTKYNHPDFKLTRHDISEFKGAIKPFAYFFTLNATEDEYEEGIMRIYYDKFRKHKSGQTIKIYQSRENGRFYDPVKTLKTFYSEGEIKH